MGIIQNGYLPKEKEFLDILKTGEKEVSYVSNKLEMNLNRFYIFLNEISFRRKVYEFTSNRKLIIGLLDNDTSRLESGNGKKMDL